MEPLSLLDLLITLCLTIGGFMAYRHGFMNTVNEVQERVIRALQSEIQALHDRIATLEQENKRLNQSITTISAALLRFGIHVTLDGDFVSIHNHTSDEIHSTDGLYTTHIYGMDEADEGERTNKHRSSSAPAANPTTKTPRRRSKNTPLRKET